MPRASYGDRHTVSVICGDSHVVFDLTSPVVDLLVLCSADQQQSMDTMGTQWRSGVIDMREGPAGLRPPTASTSALLPIPPSCWTKPVAWKHHHSFWRLVFRTTAVSWYAGKLTDQTAEMGQQQWRDWSISFC